MKTLQQLLKDNKLDYVNSDINEENFPQPEELEKVEILHFNKVLSSAQVLEAMDKKGYRPANVYEMLNWSKDNRNSEDWVVALGSVWRFLHGRRLVVCLRRGDAERDAALHWFEVDWNDFWRFAAVRKSLDTSKPEISWEPRTLSLENKMEKLQENSEDYFNKTAEAIFDADTLYDAKEILLDYIQNLK